MKPNLWIAALAALSLSACQQQEAKQADAAQTAALEQPDAKPGVAVEGGRLVLPAVKGNPGAAYFTLDNRSGGTVIVAAVSVDGAGKAEIHQTVGDGMLPIDRMDVAAGTSIMLEPGKLHAMVFDVSPKLAAGGKTELTITFADGDKLSTPLTIEPAGGAMPDADHGDMH